MVFAARLTQRGHKIHSMDDLLALYEKGYTSETVKRIASLPHPAVQKFSVITVAVVGASRRFLAQITRHKNEVKFISASLQYSNYAGQTDFVVPYETYGQPVVIFLPEKVPGCHGALRGYRCLRDFQGRRGVPGSAEPPQCADNQRHALPWKHISASGLAPQYG